MLRDSGRNRPEGKILETVGVFEAVKQHGKYETGQVRRTFTTTRFTTIVCLHVLECFSSSEEAAGLFCDPVKCPLIPSNLPCISNLLISSCCRPQLFLHSVFGYRGIVLFPWHARLYDRDITPPMSDR